MGTFLFNHYNNAHICIHIIVKSRKSNYKKNKCRKVNNF